jgi:DNA excision repair protein ERCC-4
MTDAVNGNVFSGASCPWVCSDGVGDAGSPRAPRPLDVAADDREAASGVVEQLRLDKTIRLTVRRLDLGDYLVGNRVLIERKTVADFSASIVDGRLFRQACRMASGACRPLVLIEGHVPLGGACGVGREAIQGAMIMLAVFLNIPCLRSFDAGESVALIRYAAAQLRRDIGVGIYRHGRRPGGLRKRRLFVLQGLPGIGPARAGRLLDAFGGIERVVSADAATLAQVPGIGRKTAEAIRRLVGPDPGQEAERDPVAMATSATG